jgi:hypothetical protein
MNKILIANADSVMRLLYQEELTLEGLRSKISCSLLRNHMKYGSLSWTRV